MSQTILITTRADLVQIRKQQYIDAGYRIEAEQPANQGMCSFRAVRVSSGEESNNLEDLIWSQVASARERLNRPKRRQGTTKYPE